MANQNFAAGPRATAASRSRHELCRAAVAHADRQRCNGAGFWKQKANAARAVRVQIVALRDIDTAPSRGSLDLSRDDKASKTRRRCGSSTISWARRRNAVHYRASSRWRVRCVGSSSARRDSGRTRHGPKLRAIRSSWGNQGRWTCSWNIHSVGSLGVRRRAALRPHRLRVVTVLRFLRRAASSPRSVVGNQALVRLVRAGISGALGELGFAHILDGGVTFSSGLPRNPVPPIGDRSSRS